MSKYKYKIISFEPSQLNYYILRKNFCINRDSNIILINKGLYTEDKKCDLYNLKGNIGNGMIICDNVNKKSSLKNLFKTGEIVLTKLSNSIPFINSGFINFVIATPAIPNNMSVSKQILPLMLNFSFE